MTAPVIPVSSTELEEMVSDKKVMDQVYADPSTFRDFLTKFANANSKADPEISKQVEEQVQTTLADFARDNKVVLKKGEQTLSPRDADAVRALNTATGRLYGGNAALGNKLDGQFKNFGEFMRTVVHNADTSNPEIAAKRREIKNALSSNIPAEGGFLIPEEFRTELLQLALTESIMRPGATVIPMASLRVALPMIDSTSNVSSVFGGIVAYWTEEAATLVESKPTFGQIVLDAKKLTARSDIPNELMADSAVSMDAFVGQKFPQALGWYEDAAFVSGSGAGEPLGMLNAANPSLIVQTAVSGQGANTITWANVAAMFSRMLPSSLGKAVWVITPDAFVQLATMTIGNSTLSPIWIGTGQGSEAPPVTLLGRPVYLSEKAPSTLGTQGDISFIDRSQYLIGDRMAMTAASSPHARFVDDVTVFRFIERVDGRPWMQSPITPKNGGPPLSSAVQLNSTRT
jgi:HK97 family phage major capsid protein